MGVRSVVHLMTYCQPRLAVTLVSVQGFRNEFFCGLLGNAVDCTWEEQMLFYWNKALLVLQSLASNVTKQITATCPSSWKVTYTAPSTQLMLNINTTDVKYQAKIIAIRKKTTWFLASKINYLTLLFSKFSPSFSFTGSISQGLWSWQI